MTSAVADRSRTAFKGRTRALAGSVASEVVANPKGTLASFPAKTRSRVFVSRLPDIDALRRELTVPSGCTISEIVALALPDVSQGAHARTHVWLVSDSGEWEINRDAWRARPKPGMTIVIRVEPGKNVLRTFLQIAISIAAAAIVGPLAGLFFPLNSFGNFALSAALQMGLQPAGGVSCNALRPGGGK